MEKHDKDRIVKKLFERFYEEFPSLEKFGESGKRRTEEDINYHFQYLETAYKLESIQIFTDYSKWLQDILTSRGLDSFYLVLNFKWLIEEMKETDAEEKNFYIQALEEGIKVLEALEAEGSQA
ncbi:hypothetical protein KZX50_01645 [Bacillus infantis]|uniref:hypothetical protein n=1 Tax=Bacillus infantis TaxID=324767 RepID=UPI000B9C0CAF|nr:hypothetical protein [Bacillus infantis]MCK6204156.1 hypothetical protein [Bacillus infantis]OXT17266.1 hypothetical protein B9K06_10670 [Bacillus sp. OG2]